MKIIVGLGNPGEEYSNTRHNIGFQIVDALCDELGGKFKKTRFRALSASLSKDFQKIVLIKPLTFMNLSGEAVQAALRFFKRSPEHLLVVHDDLDLPLGRIKFSDSASAGGHNGVSSIIESLNTKAFTRLRVGVSRPEGPQDAVDFVLSTFRRGEKSKVTKIIELATQAIDFYLTRGLTVAMNEYNKK